MTGGGDLQEEHGDPAGHGRPHLLPLRHRLPHRSSCHRASQAWCASSSGWRPCPWPGWDLSTMPSWCSRKFQLDLNLESLGADFYTGNLHKWCFAPRGAAFLWVAAKHRESIEPLVTSHLYKQDLTDQFFMQARICCTLSLSSIWITIIITNTQYGQYTKIITQLGDQLSSRAQWTRRATWAAAPRSRSTSGWEVAPPWWSTPSLSWTGLSRCSVTLLAHQCFPFLQICRYVPIKLLSTSNSRVECAMYNTKCTNFTCFVSRKLLFDIMITNPYLHSASLIILTKL